MSFIFKWTKSTYLKSDTGLSLSFFAFFFFFFLHWTTAIQRCCNWPWFRRYSQLIMNLVGISKLPSLFPVFHIESCEFRALLEENERVIGSWINYDIFSYLVIFSYLARYLGKIKSTSSKYILKSPALWFLKPTLTGRASKAT